jgi:hypothetical protein
MDVMVMLYHLHKHAKKHGHLDAERTLAVTTRALNAMHALEASLVESALYCCNMLNEDDDFLHPMGLSFDEFVNKVLKGKTFNRVYNMIEVSE